MKAVLTGSEGFIGKHVKEKLTKMGFNVVRIDNFSNSLPTDSITPKDISHENLVDKFNGAKVVVHLAAMGSIPRCNERPMSCYLNNVIGFNNVLSNSILSEVPIFIYASSSSVLGNSTYGLSKRINEATSLMINSNYLFKIKCIGLRFFNIFGPGQRWDIDNAAFIPMVIDSVYKNRKISLYNNGNNYRDFTPVSVVCNTIEKIIKNHKEMKSTVVDVGLGSPKKCIDVLDLISERMKIKFNNFELKEKRSFELEESIADTKTLKDLGIDLSHYTFENEIKNTVDYYLRLDPSMRDSL